MYFCGPTVYARAHVGNAVPFVLGMWLRGWLHERGYEVTLVHNITDINDKIYDAAPGASADFAARATQWYLEDTRDLGLGLPDHLPKATESVPQIVHFIEELIEGGHAYSAEGDVYFRVRSYPEYGQLSRQKPGQMEEEESNDLKEDPRDFALWKATKEGEDTSWESPWGPGRPGWHIECSAMAEQLLGVGFDIHGGGSDLVFPHHENEAAQTRAARGSELARLWVHNGMIQLTGEKMAKSLGNIAPLHEVLADHGRDAVAMYLIPGHYRQPLAFSQAELDDAERSVRRIRETLRRVRPGPSPPELAHHKDAFFDALANDFNTPAARDALLNWLREANSLAG